MYCANCENKINEDTVFCPLCGAKVEQSKSVMDNKFDNVANYPTSNVADNLTDNATNNVAYRVTNNETFNITANSTESSNKKRLGSKKNLILGILSLVMVIIVISIFLINSTTTDNRNSTKDISTYTVKILADNPTQRQTDAIINVLRKRLEKYSKNADVKIWHTNLIIIKVPKLDNINLNIIKDNLSSGKLEFKDTSGKILITNNDVQSAKLLMDKNTKAYLVGINFTEEGSKKLSDVTQDYLGEELDIYYEDNLLLAATVEAVISIGEAVIGGFDERKDAERVICGINSGCLPIELEVEEIVGAE